MFNGSDAFRIHRRLDASALHEAKSKLHQRNSQVWSIFCLTIYSSVVLTGFFCLLSIIAPAGSRSMNAGRYRDPFAHYNIFLPGQAAQAWMLRRCYASIPSSTQICVVKRYDIDPAPGKFEELAVTVQDGVFQTLWIRMATNDVQVADLVHQWGRPDVITRKPSFFILEWNRGVIALVRGTGWFHYRLAVEKVFVTSEFR